MYATMTVLIERILKTNDVFMFLLNGLQPQCTTNIELLRSDLK